MSLLSQKAVALLLTAVASLGALEAQAAKASAGADAPAQNVSLLAGKFTFTLPKGFIASALPGGDAANGTAGAKGTLYTNAASKTVVIAAENTIPNGVTVKDNDGDFLDSSAADFVAQQTKALPDFKLLSEKSLSKKAQGLGVRQIDSRVTQGGGPTLDTTLLTASGTRMALVQVISRPGDTLVHEALVKKILTEQ
ncbi:MULTISPECIES: hypothetical protein [unclassified Pseudomonas]|uniref:hypothetical protein n=1 Tax=unclassified Pseudomonas TaxID=196821 RepID=UPI002AC90C6B|nr:MULTISPECIES: hypothetical protein [unclassified Pseudomonas]MEB0045895.1 hypothetical protein [Pseudomonas sp. Dout3]MEB0097155.1 hypothetical protein [Pseudomonas sp. DC1.2]WPX56908.1 hypothetical protein RHM68_14685 [Pseudomonas sp. DC1.2]